jgi:SAM-dependent methyltransferase
MGMLKRARAKFPDLSLVHGDVTSLPFSSEIFDGAIAIQVLHHIKEEELFMREAYRVLRKGTHLAVDSCSHQQMRTFWLYHYFPKGLDLDLARIPDCGEITSLLERVGFTDVTIEISYTDVALEHEEPEHYLDKDYRDGQSTFCLLTEEDIELGCRKLSEDVASGTVKSVINQFEKMEMKAGGSCIIYGRKRSG